MTAWRVLQIVAWVIAFVVGGTAGALAANWCLARVARCYLVDTVIHDKIRPPRVLYARLDERVRSETEQRRREADRLRRASARLESGDVALRRLRRVK